MGGSDVCDGAFDGTMTSTEQEDAFWFGIVHVDLWKERGNFWKSIVFITRQIRISNKCFNFRDACKIGIRDSLGTEELLKRQIYVTN